MTVGNRPASSLTRRAYVSLAVTLAGVALFVLSQGGCGGSDGEESTSASPEVIAARDLAAELSLVGKMWDEAQTVLAPITARPDAAAEDLLRAANAHLAEDEGKEAGPLIDRAAQLLPETDPVLAWCQFRRARLEFENEEAVRHLRLIRAGRTREGGAAGDVPVTLALGVVLEDLGEFEEARTLYEEVVALPSEITVAWRVLAIYRLARLLSTLGEDANQWFEEYRYWTEEQGISSPGEPAHQAGTLGALQPHTPGVLERPRPSVPGVQFTAERLAEVGGGIVSFRRTRGELAGRDSRRLEEVFDWTPAPAALLRFGTDGLSLLEETGGSGWKTTELWHTAVVDAIAFDRKNAGAQPGDLADAGRGDQHMDILALAGGAIWLFEDQGSGWGEQPVSILEVGGAGDSGRLLALDYDHDGDLDLLCAQPTGTRIFRNDGFDQHDDGFTEVTAEFPLPQGDLFPSIEDMDSDSDVDILLLARGGALHLLSNLRGGNFAPAQVELPSTTGATHVLAADFDGDARPDLAIFGKSLEIHLRNALGGWRKEALVWPLAAAPTGAPQAVDWDLDGSLDLLWPTREHPAAGLLGPGHANGGVGLVLGAPFETPQDGAATLAIGDVDNDRDLDLVHSAIGGVTLHRSDDGPRGVLFGLTGHKDNAAGTGAIVEARVGIGYTRVYWRGGPLLLGTNGTPQLDLVRVSWPNGVVQNEIDLPLESIAGGAQGAGKYLLWQRRGLAGSCPFVYTWNGSTYEYISDVLGITPLGLPMEPGLLVPPDHDEYVLIKGDKLVPRDGFYEMQFTEELREVTYLDRLRLDVIDHPAGIEIFPNERFSFPPFPEAHTHTIRTALEPVDAHDGEGRDWTEELARDDEVLAVPFTPVRGQFQGLATPHYIELTFDRGAVQNAEGLRLLLNGWLYWTDASVNVAAARHPDHAFIPPILQVPDGEGSWRDAGPPIGFPAGKLKTMVVDVSDWIDRDDPRIRIFTTLRLYWDSIRLAVDGGDAPLRVTSIEPSSAELWNRGFSRPIPMHGEHELDWFEWDELEEEPRWNQHPGLYTRFGETVSLVSAIDDRFVVMGAGDALRVRFDASEAPALPEGWERDYLIFLDGWAKDRDPNTVEALFVEPLPFHGMSAYPYGPDESFPDDEVHRAWRRDWQTREARRWIPSLVPGRAPAR